MYSCLALNRAETWISCSRFESRSYLSTVSLPWCHRAGILYVLYCTADYSDTKYGVWYFSQQSVGAANEAMVLYALVHGTRWGSTGALPCVMSGLPKRVRWVEYNDMGCMCYSRLLCSMPIHNQNEKSNQSLALKIRDTVVENSLMIIEETFQCDKQNNSETNR